MKKNFFKFISLFYCLSILVNIIQPKIVSAAINVNNPETISNENLYITGYLSENGEVKIYSHNNAISDRSITATVTIGVFLKGVIIGYLSSVVIDGVIISATGKSGGEWVSYAIKEVIGKKYSSVKSGVHLSCSIFPPNSYQGAMCRN